MQVARARTQSCVTSGSPAEDEASPEEKRRCGEREQLS